MNGVSRVVKMAPKNHHPDSLTALAAGPALEDQRKGPRAAAEIEVP